MMQCNTKENARSLDERREDIRVIVSLPGRYVLPKRRGSQGRSQEFACRLVNISPRGMVLAGPVIGAVGEPIVTYFEEFGKLKGSVIRTLYGGFAMTIDATETQRAQLASKLAWMEKHLIEDAPNARQHKRIVPQNPHSTLILADGSMLACFVIDMSASGVAVSADVRPPIGMPLAVGRIVGRVVRRFAEGFAVRFTQEQDPRFLEQFLIKPFTAPPPAARGGLDLGDLIVIDVREPAERRIRARA
jgi:hypothetical protein